MPRSPRISPEQWADARVKWRAGLSYGDLARELDVHQSYVSKTFRDNGWDQDNRDLHAVLDRRTVAKVAGIVAGDDNKRIEAALDSEADKRAAIVVKHREQWAQLEALRLEAVRSRKYGDLAKAAKASVETLAAMQLGERKAWGLDQPQTQTGPTVQADEVRASLLVRLERVAS